MHAFIVSEAVTVNTGKFIRHYPAAKPAAETPIDSMFIDCGGESKLLKDFLEKQHTEEAEEDAPKSPPVNLIGEPQLLAWVLCPPRLGRLSAKLIHESLQLYEEAEPLLLQLAVLKARCPHKKHFRFALVNGYGTNLGDATLGATAMRMVASVMTEQLGSFSCDVFVGVQSGLANADIVGYEPWVAQVFFESPSLQTFSRYDGYFDFTNLINLPKFTDLPTVDWYLWWCGLDAKRFAIEQKRNRMTIRWDAWQTISQLLKSVGDGKRVLFNPKASVPLRSCSPEIAARIAKKILDADNKLQLVIDQPLDFTNKRLINFAGKIDSPYKFMALIAQMDGVITVDSFAPQLVDACSVPAVHICTSLPVETYPYYPFSHVCEIPGARDLPAWLKFKLENDEQWIEMKDAYDKAWSKLDVRAILKALDEKIALRQSSPNAVRPFLTSENHQHKIVVERLGMRQLRYENVTAVWVRATQRLIDINRVFLKPGMTAILMTPGQASLPLAMASKLMTLGHLHVFEPRVLRRQLMAADVSSQAVQLDVCWHTNIPVPNCKQVKINDTDAFAQTDPTEWGNLPNQVEIPAASIDSFNLTACHCLVMMPPMPWSLSLQGALETIRKFRPALFFAPITKDAARAVLALLKDDNYQFWAESALEKGDMENMVLLGFDHAQKVNLAGYIRVTMD